MRRPAIAITIVVAFTPLFFVPNQGAVGASNDPKTLGTNVLRLTTDNGKDPVKKGVEYTGTVSVNGAAALPLENLGVRGNSTANDPKKPYKIKFPGKTSVYGFPANKSWVLIPNFLDFTLVRNKMALDLAGRMSGLRWTPRSTFAEVFMNGKYMGAYQFAESIKIDKDRVNVSKTKGMVVELDPDFKKEGVPGFYGQKKLPYTFKDPDERKITNGVEDPEGITDDKLAALKARVKAFEAALYGSKSADPAVGYAKYLDMPAAIDFYLVKEFIKEHDSDFFGSTYFSWNDYTDPSSKFEMGPEWDADRSAGNKPLKKTEFTNSPKGWFMRGSGTTHPTSKTGYYAYMAKDKNFIKAVEARWAVVKPLFKAVGDSKVNEAVNQLGVAVTNDRSRWPGTSGRPYPRRGSYSDEITYVKSWYKARYKWMDGELN